MAWLVGKRSLNVQPTVLSATAHLPLDGVRACAAQLRRQMRDVQLRRDWFTTSRAATLTSKAEVPQIPDRIAAARSELAFRANWRHLSVRRAAVAMGRERQCDIGRHSPRFAELQAHGSSLCANRTHRLVAEVERCALLC